MTDERVKVCIPDTIERLDFSPIAMRLHAQKGWSKDRVENAVNGYRQFLTLLQRNPCVPLVPSEDIDEVWHDHILWTQRYAQDCTEIFDYFVHHYPCFDMSDPAIVEWHRNNREKTKLLFQEAFGQVPASYSYGEVHKSGSCTCYVQE